MLKSNLSVKEAPE